MTAEERKKASIALLKAQNIPYIDWLLLVEEESDIHPRSAEEIARRAIACLLAIQVACDYANGEEDIEKSRVIIMDVAARLDVQNDFTPKEQIFFDGDPNQQECINMVWKYEACWPLFWALGLVPELGYPDKTCDCDLLIQSVAPNDSLDDFMDNVHLRSTNEILDATDLLCRYDWACVDARLKGQEIPGNLDSGVVVERHIGLNWLVGKETDNGEWDDVSADT